MTRTKTATTHSPATQTAGTDPVSPAVVKAVGKSAKPAGARTGDLEQANSTATVIAAATAAPPPRQTKAALLRMRLAEPGGASLAALMAATGWQAHTLRAALSGLRKAGVTLVRHREGEDTIYAIAARDEVAQEVNREGEEGVAGRDATLPVTGDDRARTEPTPQDTLPPETTEVGA